MTNFDKTQILYNNKLLKFLNELDDLPNQIDQCHVYQSDAGIYDQFNRIRGRLGDKIISDSDCVLFSCIGENFEFSQGFDNLIGKKVLLISPRILAQEQDKFNKLGWKNIYFPETYAIYPKVMPKIDLNLDRTFDKIFLSLNNRAQWPRQALYHFIMKFELSNKFYFSYHMEDRWNIGKELLWKQTNDIVGTNTWFNEGLDFNLLFDRLPVTLDNFLGNDWSPGNLEYFNSSFCSVVAETYIGENQDPFLTEKTFKPLAYGHPMLIHSSQGALSRLRELGFETFSSILDESYDLIESPQERFEELLRQILELSNKSNNELSLMFEKIKPVLRHNYYRFWNGLPEEYDVKIKDIKEEIKDYFGVDN